MRWGSHGSTNICVLIFIELYTKKNEGKKQFFPRIVVGVIKSHLALFHLRFKRTTNMETANQKVARRGCELQGLCDN